MNRVLITTALLILTALLAPCQAKQLKNEGFYAQQWCRENKGKFGTLSPSDGLIDCLTSQYAVDCAFAEKWPETIGRALFNALETSKDAGVCLILKSPQEQRYWLDLNRTITHHKLPIRTWLVQP